MIWLIEPAIPERDASTRYRRIWGMDRQIASGDIATIDLFCGAGGLTQGFIQAGLRVIAGIDIDPSCKYPYEYNNKCLFIEHDIEHLPADTLRTLFSGCSRRVLAGCAPCQPFSSYSQGIKAGKTANWRLLYAFARLVSEIRPEVVTMENVPRVMRHPVYDDFRQTLEALDYFVTAYRVFCPDYGIPQTRTRLVLLASTIRPIQLRPPTHAPTDATVRKAIGTLQPLRAGDSSPIDRLHKACRLSPLNIQRIQASKPGGTWRDWNDSLVADCHRDRKGTTYPSVYGRMEWDKPGPTITTQCFGFGNGRFGHPEQDRAITLREAALLQTFPEDYQFVRPDQPLFFSSVGRLIGNSVPINLGIIIGQSIIDHIMTDNCPHRMS